MEKQPSVAQMFRYEPEAIRLIGFPSTTPLIRLSTMLGSEISLREHRAFMDGRNCVIPSFPLEYLSGRQAFFGSLPEESIRKDLFSRHFPKRKDARGNIADFLKFCQNVYETLNDLREGVKYFEGLPEGREVLDRTGQFDKDLGAVLKTLEDIEANSTFAMSSETGVIMPIK